MPLCCISRDRLSSGGSGEGMAVGRQLVPRIPVDVGREHHPAIGDQLVQDDLCPVLGLLEPLSELLGVEHAVRPPQFAPDLDDRIAPRWWSSSRWALVPDVLAGTPALRRR